MPEPGAIFDTRPTPIRALPASPLAALLFPEKVVLGRARGSRPSERVAFLIHGLSMNEDYFGLLAPELIERGFDVWALRLPGYVASGERPGFWRIDVGISLTFYGWVVASTMAHVARTLSPRPTELLAWGHSLGGAALASAIASYVSPEWPGPSRLVFEAPAFSEAIAFSGLAIAGYSAAPDGLLDMLARAFLMDDLRSSEFAERQSLPLVPGRTSRAVFTMNVLALTNPLTRTPAPGPEWLERSWFILGQHDRLVDYRALCRLLDGWRVRSDRRLVLPRNHLLSLTSAREMAEWITAPSGS
jgi:pimeloyl-ACP methyl ester carboxylesterase